MRHAIIPRGWLTRRHSESDPFLSLWKEMDDLFGNVAQNFELLPASSASEVRASYVPRVDIKEGEKGLSVRADLPGMELKDIDVTLAEGALTIRGEKKTESEEKEKGYYRRERSFGAFERVLPLPYEVQEDKVAASFKNGVLNVELPRAEVVETKRKKIQIKES